eukprot:155500-Pyramimonas_sp.AAC.1
MARVTRLGSVVVRGRPLANDSEGVFTYSPPWGDYAGFLKVTVAVGAEAHLQRLTILTPPPPPLGVTRREYSVDMAASAVGITCRRCIRRWRSSGTWCRGAR